MIYGYIRVSSDRQTVENQRFEINNFCQRQALPVDDWIEEVSPALPYLISVRQLRGALRRAALRK